MYYHIAALRFAYDEIERLNYIINTLYNWLNLELYYNTDVNEQYAEAIVNTLDKLKALKEGKKW